MTLADEEDPSAEVSEAKRKRTEDAKKAGREPRKKGRPRKSAIGDADLIDAARATRLEIVRVARREMLRLPHIAPLTDYPSACASGRSFSSDSAFPTTFSASNRAAALIGLSR